MSEVPLYILHPTPYTLSRAGGGGGDDGGRDDGRRRADRHDG